MSERRDTQGASHGRYAYAGLDRVIHERARLGILASLATHTAGLSFNDLKALCELTDGNLNRHLSVLISAELIEASKERHKTRPKSLYRLTPAGHDRFTQYIGELQQVVDDAHRAVPPPAMASVLPKATDGSSGRVAAENQRDEPG
jgi:DNA-binding HxlR family transcriptional regulator